MQKNENIYSRNFTSLVKHLRYVIDSTVKTEKSAAVVTHASVQPERVTLRHVTRSVFVACWQLHREGKKKV